MSKLLERCKMCVDSVYRNWSICNKITKDEQREHANWEAWGIVHLALYILNFSEYNELKRYIYQMHGYDAGGATDDQISIEEAEVFANDR